MLLQQLHIHTDQSTPNPSPCYERVTEACAQTVVQPHKLAWLAIQNVLSPGVLAACVLVLAPPTAAAAATATAAGAAGGSGSKWTSKPGGRKDVSLAPLLSATQYNAIHLGQVLISRVA